MRRRGGEEPYEDYYEWDGYLAAGQAHGVPLPFNLYDYEADEVMRELREREKKRIPVGFQVPEPLAAKRRANKRTAKTTGTRKGRKRERKT